MSGGGYGGQGQGGMGNFANGGYPQRFGGFGGMQGYGGQPQGYSRYQGQQSFGGGNPWMRGGGMQPQGGSSYGNKMGFQGSPMGAMLGNQPAGATGGAQYGWNPAGMQFGGGPTPAANNQAGLQQSFADWGANNIAQTSNRVGGIVGQAQGGVSAGPGFVSTMNAQNGGLQVANDAMTIPGETYASGLPSPSTPQPSIGGPGQGGPSALPPGGSPSTSALDYAKPLGDQAKAGTMYGPGPIDTSAQYNQMVNGWQQQYQNLMGQPAPFGRYADGSPREDPNALNARAQAHQQWYGGGWGR